MISLYCLLLVIVLLVLVFCAKRYVRRKQLHPDGKSVFITGCDRGFGETLATKLALTGYRVFAGCLDVTSDGGSRLRKISNVTVLQCDVTNEASVNVSKRLLNDRLQEQGLWALVNNAGVAVFAETEWCSMAAYEKVLGVNLMGTIRVTKACLPLVRRAKGRVVNIASLAGRFALPGFTAYSASKFGCIGFTDSLRREMKKFDVKVICIEPKLYRTAISDSDFHVKTNHQMWAEADDVIKVDYGDTYFRAFLETMLTNLRYSSRKTYEVIDDLVHAVTSVYPYTRYVPSLKVQLMTDAFVGHCNFIQDRVIMSTTGVRCVPFSMRKKKTA